MRTERDPAGGLVTIEALMRERRSVRGFLPQPVPHATMRRVFETAQLAPSNCNLQPWLVRVVSGECAARMRQALREAAIGGMTSPDIPSSQTYLGEYRVRQIEAAKALFGATGVARDDGPARTENFLRNFSFFGAPHVAFLFMPQWAGMAGAADCGIFAQSLMLALTAHGLGSCAQGALGQYAAVVRRELDVPTDMLLLFGIAFGYEDTTHPANSTRTVRAPIEHVVRFHD